MDCLTLSTDGKSYFVDVAVSRGAQPRTLRTLIGIAVDASWVKGDGNRIYLLVPGPPKVPSLLIPWGRRPRQREWRLCFSVAGDEDHARGTS